MEVVSGPPLSVPSPAVAVRYVRADAWRTALLLVLLWGMGVLAMTKLDGAVVCWGPIVLLGGTAALIGRQHGAPLVGTRLRGARGSLTLDDAGVVVEMGGRRLTFTREEIAGGWTETFRDREEVVLEMRRGLLVRAAVDGAREARAVLRAAGVGPHQRAIAFRLGVSETGGMRAILVFLTLLLAPITVALVGAAVMLALARHGNEGGSGAVVAAVLAVLSGSGLWVMARPLVTTTLRVGTDGVVVQRLGRRRFFARATLTSVGVRDDAVVLRRIGGVPVTVRTSGRTEAAAVAVRIREAMFEGGASAGPEALSRLDRHGRTVTDWLREVRALGKEQGGYRDAALDAQALLDVLEDGAAPPDRRIAAAAVLSAAPAGDSAVRARVRAAAETCADPRLRVALEAAGAGEEDVAQVEAAVRATSAG